MIFGCSSKINNILNSYLKDLFSADYESMPVEPAEESQADGYATVSTYVVPCTADSSSQLTDNSEDNHHNNIHVASDSLENPSDNQPGIIENVFADFSNFGIHLSDILRKCRKNYREKINESHLLWVLVALSVKCLSRADLCVCQRKVRILSSRPGDSKYKFPLVRN